jgi:SAM-dependent methyltransferase
VSETQPTYRCFHPITQQAYGTVHQWIEASIGDAHGYKSLSYNNLKKKLQETDWKHIAFQYYALFPAHYFKAIHVLDAVIGEERLLTWLRHQQKICFLDIGCGGGAASAAFLDTVIRLKECGKLKKDINILFIGVDPTANAIGLYIQTMQTLKSLTTSLVNLEFKYVMEGFPNAVSYIDRYLKDYLRSSRLPCFSNALVMQLNVISPFSQTYRNRQAELDKLRALGIEVDNSSVERDAGLGTAEAQAYKQLIESVPIDVMHILTIGTKNMEKQVQIGTDSETTLAERIKDMSTTLCRIIGNRHLVEQINSESHFVHVENPVNSYWRDKGKNKTEADKPVEFYADFCIVFSADRKDDEEWNKIIGIENLRLAWARARNNLLRETLCDETEMRLFDLNLELRLEGLREQLCAYANDVALTDEDFISSDYSKARR